MRDYELKHGGPDRDIVTFADVPVPLKVRYGFRTLRSVSKHAALVIRRPQNDEDPLLLAQREELLGGRLSCQG